MPKILSQMKTKKNVAHTHTHTNTHIVYTGMPEQNMAAFSSEAPGIMTLDYLDYMPPQKRNLQ